MALNFLQGVFGATINAAPVILRNTSPQTANLKAGYAYDFTLTQNSSFSFSNPPSGFRQVVMLTLRQAAGGGFTPVFPAGIKWPGGIAPTPNNVAGIIDDYVFTTTDGGVTWLGAKQGSGTNSANASSTLPTTTTYTASGPIAVTDRKSLLNASSAALAMTLANGTTDGWQLLIEVLGANTVTVAGMFGGSNKTITISSSTSPNGAISLVWDAANATWEIV